MDNRNILVVDDVEQISELVGAILNRRKLGKRIFCSSSPADALDCIVHVNRIDCAFVDIMMPGVTGFDILAALKRHHPHCAVYIMTCADTEENRVKATTLGASGFIPKPFGPTEIVNMLGRGMN